MLNKILKFFSGGTKSERDIKNITPLVNEAKKHLAELRNVSNDELRERTIRFKQKIHENVKAEQDEINTIKSRIEVDLEMPIAEKEELFKRMDSLSKTEYEKTQKTLNAILPEAFAVVRETARRFKDNESVEVTATQMDKDIAAERDNVNVVGDKAYWDHRWMAGGNMITWDMEHYDVQLIGGTVLHQGKIAEMATGEGKTLVATLAIYLNALPGKGVHVVTVNDYLAKRDSEWMGVLFEFHGLRVDCIDKHEPNSLERRNAYLADVTYGTNNEFGFDYLRDNMARNKDELVQREHYYAIVDEVDSVLIDDARTPLIISGPTPRGENQEFETLKPEITKLYNEQRQLATRLLAEAKSLLVTDETGKIDPENEKKGGEALLRAYRALPKNKPLIRFLSEPGIKQQLLKTENFYMQEQSKNMHIIDEPLFFVIDEKNNTIELTEKGIDLITKSYEDPKFYIMPDVGAEIADLEKLNLPPKEKAEAKSEIYRDFAIKSERIHTVNQLLKAYALFEKDVEYIVVDNKVKIVDEQTGRVLEGRRYSDGLHQAIEAKENVKVEAATQTYATITLQNYFRMYNKLAGMTGTAETEAGEFWDIYKLDVVVIPTNKPIIRNDQEDLIYKTKKDKYNAVIQEIKQLTSEGRPVLVGTTSVEISELLSRMLNREKIKHNVLNAKLHQREAQIVAEAGLPGNVTIATNMAGRGTDIKLGKGVKEAGGLAIIGTERHESRRVDRQLRGRAGRQGDPGSSQFFVSLEDDLMRMFGSDNISKIMDRMGLKEGEVIQHSMITKSIERAQKKVEENNFGIRKRLLEYDDVMNAQREVIYNKRKQALFGDRLALEISNMIYDLGENIIEENKDDENTDNLNIDLISAFAIENIFDDKELKSDRTEVLADKLFDHVYEQYLEKNKRIAEITYPVIKRIYESNQNYQYIGIPITDGRKTINVAANLEKAYNDKGKEVALAVEKFITLSMIDDAWKEHLREMDDLKQSVQSASYEQKDPLLIYKLESFELFKSMINKVNKDIISFLFKAHLPEDTDSKVRETKLPERTNKEALREQRAEVFGHDTQTNTTNAPVKVEKKTGRNEPCPCGSGKKFKNCHGRA